MSWTIRAASDDDADLAAIASVVNAVTPEEPTSVEELRWARTTYPGGLRVVAELAGAIVGTGEAGRIYVYPATFERFWLTLHVVPVVRRRGIGTALYRALSGHARAAGKTGFQTELSEAQADGHAFFAHRGFVEHERSASVALDLVGLDPPEVTAPTGIAITTLAERSDLVSGVHAVAVAAFPDIPHSGEPVDAGTLTEFRLRDVDRPAIPHDLFAIAVDERSGDVVGYASLFLVPGSRTVAYHDMTAVHPAHRGRGIASALKRATIAAAIRAGLERLETGNDVENAPMRAINDRLGFRPMPDVVGLRGPLDDGIIAP